MYNDYNNEVAKFENLLGRVIRHIEGAVGSERLVFTCANGDVFQLIYYQDCCASCSIEEIHGDLSDLIGKRIRLAEEVHSKEPDGEILEQRKVAYEKARTEFVPRHQGDEFCYFGGPGPDTNWKTESETWVFYKLATIKGSVTIRWYGSSNGYYSETATFEKVKRDVRRS